MSRKLLLAFALLPIIATFVGFSLTWSTPPVESPQQGNAPGLSAPVGTQDRQAPAPSSLVGQAVAVPEQLPASLAGTEEPGGWLTVDGNGDLLPTPALRALFEYYLAALGEETLAQLVTRIENALAALPQPARDQARETLARYLDYKLAVGELEAGVGDGTDAGPEARLVQIRNLRRQYLDAATAEAFFAADEAVDRFQLERRRILADASLDPGQRQARVAAAEAALPEPLLEARREAGRFQDYQRAREQLADDPAALAAYREARFGADGARALARVEQEQADWDRRWQAYREAVTRLEVAGLAAPEHEAAIRRLRQEHFSGSERLRAEALDSLH